jgi:sporulation protein YlmC with PRC-barrel domain
LQNSEKITAHLGLASYLHVVVESFGTRHAYRRTFASRGRLFMTRLLATLLVGSLAATWSSAGLAADDKADTKVEPKDKILVARTFRTSALTGLNVRNKQGEKLGTVNDLVIDIPTGKISYVAVSVGGVLGVGDKMFAVPYTSVKFDHGNDEMFFVLDMPKERLEAAPGFDQSNWPNFADPHWSDKIDKYYREAQKPDTRTTERREVVN